jgi:type I restriction enzyme S subunit
MSSPSKQDSIPHKLDDLGFLGRGKSKHRPRNDPSLYGGTYPFFQTGDVKNAEMYLSDYTQTYNEKGLAQSKIWKAGTLCITIAANIAETAILTIDGCFPDSIVGFVADDDKCDVKFIKYYIDFIKLNMQSISRGTTQDNLSLDKLLTFDFLTPPLPIQSKIASVLSAYDDLIENNSRRIEILEEMAQRIYREWFINFRFPGHEKVKMVDSPLGPIPEGWERVGFHELLKSSLGGDWGKDSLTVKETCPVAVIRGTDFGDVRYGNSLRVPERYISEASLTKRRLHPGDIIVENSVNAKSRSVGSTRLITQELLNRISADAIAASFCKVFRPKDSKIASLMQLHLAYLYDEDRMLFYQNVAANGIGNFQAKRFIESEYMSLPSDIQLKVQMAEFFAELHNCASNLAHRIHVLRHTRDLLLPKLISGEVSVEDLDVDPEEVSEAEFVK